MNSPLGDFVIGCGTFAEQYNADPSAVAIVDIFRTAQSLGIHTLDTSPYYGPSEILVGQALAQVPWLQRDQWTLCTKVGRIAANEFDYSAAWVRKSVLRSLERLVLPSFPDAKVGDPRYFLDVVYVHDVEFQTLDQALCALKELRKMQSEGLVRRVGISGYPLAYLYEVALAASNDRDIGPLDAILSYCNLNLQNTALLEWERKFRDECGISVVSNASVLSMSLLRAQETVSWHPASAELKQCAKEAAEYCNTQGLDLAGLAVKYAMAQWLGHGATLVGVSSVAELQEGVRAWEELRGANTLSQGETSAVQYIQEKIFAGRMGETWPSGRIAGTDSVN